MPQRSPRRCHDTHVVIQSSDKGKIEGLLRNTEGFKEGSSGLGCRRGAPVGYKEGQILIEIVGGQGPPNDLINIYFPRQVY